MSGSLISVLPAALRQPYGAAVGGVRAIQPVVQKTTAWEAFTPPNRAARTDAGSTVYTPGAAHNSSDPKLYSPKGTLQGAVYQSVNVARDDSFNLEIKTAQGDIATISISQKQSFNVTGTAATSAQGSAWTLDIDSSDTMNAQIAVNGELDAQERASIQNLMQQVGDVAADFFAGDMKQAVKGAARLDIQGQADTLSAFSFELQSHEVRQAVAMYEGVAAATSGTPQNNSPFLKNPMVIPVANHNAVGNAIQDASISDSKRSNESDSTPRKEFLQNLLALFDDLTRSAKEILQPSAAPAGHEAALVMDV